MKYDSKNNLIVKIKQILTRQMEFIGFFLGGLLKPQTSVKSSPLSLKLK